MFEHAANIIAGVSAVAAVASAVYAARQAKAAREQARATVIAAQVQAQAMRDAADEATRSAARDREVNEYQHRRLRLDERISRCNEAVSVIYAAAAVPNLSDAARDEALRQSALLFCCLEYRNETPEGTFWDEASADLRSSVWAIAGRIDERLRVRQAVPKQEATALLSEFRRLVDCVLRAGA